MIDLLFRNLLGNLAEIKLATRLRAKKTRLKVKNDAATEIRGFLPETDQKVSISILIIIVASLNVTQHDEGHLD